MDSVWIQSRKAVCHSNELGEHHNVRADQAAWREYRKDKELAGQVLHDSTLSDERARFKALDCVNKIFKNLEKVKRKTDSGRPTLRTAYLKLVCVALAHGAGNKALNWKGEYLGQWDDVATRVN